MTIFAGRLDTVVDFQRITTSQDGMGGTTEAWATIDNSSTRAEYIPLRGSESLEAQKITAKQLFKLRIRRFNLTPADRVVVDGRNCDIKSIEDNKRRGRDMVIWCEVRD